MSLGAVRRATTGIGTITPSGNVVVERVTTALLQDFPDVSGHYSRTAVHGSADLYADDYDWDGMLRAAALLSHCGPAAIVWNGSKGGSLGFDVDRRLCDRIVQETGVPATTSTLAIEAVLRADGHSRVALVTPYAEAYAKKIPPHFAVAGFEVVAKADAALTDNLSFAALPDADVVAMARSVAEARPDAIIAYCTNMPAAHLAAELEAELGIPFYDSTSAAVWGALRLAGVPTAPGRQWGSLFGRDLELSAPARG